MKSFMHNLPIEKFRKLTSQMRPARRQVTRHPPQPKSNSSPTESNPEGAPSLCLRSLQTQGGDFDFLGQQTFCSERTYPLARPPLFRHRFASTFPINCDCNFCAHPSPHTCSAPSCTASCSSHCARCITGIFRSSSELHITHHRSLIPFITPQFGPAHRCNALGTCKILSVIFDSQTARRNVPRPPPLENA